MANPSELFYFSGSWIRRAVLPEGTRVLSASAASTKATDAVDAIKNALYTPVAMAPIDGLVRPNSRVVIAFDDPAVPVPLMRRDLRAIAAEVVVEELRRLKVSESSIRFLCANGLHRKYTLKELHSMLGRQIIARFGDRIHCHDAEDSRSIAFLGETSSGHPVEVNRALVECDIVIYLSIPWTPMNGGWKSIAVGCGTYKSISAHHQPDVLASGGIMEPANSTFHRFITEAGEVIRPRTQVLQIEMALTNRLWEDRFSYLQPGARHQFFRRLFLSAYNSLPGIVRSALLRRIRSGYGLAAVKSGEPGAVHREMLPVVERNLFVPVDGQSDVVFFGVPDLSPYSVFLKMNPLLAANVALGYVFNLHQNMPVVKKGGVLIFSHPFNTTFDAEHHPSYIDFFSKVLLETRSAAEMSLRFEKVYARNTEFVKLYRERCAFHGVHPFYAWYWCAPALNYLGKVIVADAKDPDAVRRCGFEPARSIGDALTLAKEFLGRNYSLTYLWLPPLFGCAVTGK